VPLFGAPASLTATPGNSQATLAWSAVAGATGYYVWQRDATAGQAWVQLPYPAGHDQLDRVLLLRHDRLQPHAAGIARVIPRTGGRGRLGRLPLARASGTVPSPIRLPALVTIARHAGPSLGQEVHHQLIEVVRTLQRHHV
jgi:hypothetical protein